MRIGRVLAQDELLDQVVEDAGAGVDGSTREDQSRPAIARRVVDVCERARNEIAANA